jgi:hypothetical protein
MFTVLWMAYRCTSPRMRGCCKTAVPLYFPAHAGVFQNCRTAVLPRACGGVRSPHHGGFFLRSKGPARAVSWRDRDPGSPNRYNRRPAFSPIPCGTTSASRRSDSAASSACRWSTTACGNGGAPGCGCFQATSKAIPTASSGWWSQWWISCSSVAPSGSSDAAWARM